MNIIKVLFGCSSIGKIDDVPYVVGAQHRPVCAIHNRLVTGYFGCSVPGNQGFPHIVVHTTHAKDICSIAHVPCTNLGFNRR